jgi:replicative DNA helicase
VPVEIDESLTAICDALRKQKLYADIAGVLTDVGELTSGDPFVGFEALQKKVVTLMSMHTIDNTTTVNSMMSQIRTEYVAMKEGAVKLKGYPYPWPALNEMTLGLQRQQLVFIYGRPKSCKSWLLLEIGRVLHEHGLRPLIFSQEMSEIEIARRFVALSCSVNYNQFMRGDLPEAIENEFMGNLEMFVEREDVPISVLPEGETCIPDLMAKVDDYKADVVLLDGVNYLSTDWRELAEITRALKRTAKAKNIPIIGSTHANRSRKKNADLRDEADDFAYGDAFYQVADLALRVSSDIEDKKLRQVKVYPSAMREGSPMLFTVNTILCENLTQKSVEQMGEVDLEDEIAQNQLDAASDLPEETRVTSDLIKEAQKTMQAAIKRVITKK